MLLPNSALTQTDERITLEYADTLRSRGNVRELIGNVKVNRGDRRITADRALYDTDAGVIRLTGKVKLTEPSRRVRADRMRYDENSGNFEAQGAVDVAVGDSLRIRCYTAYYTDKTSILELENNLIIDMFSDSSQITGGWGLFNLKDSSGVIEGSPVYRLLIKDDVKRDTLIIKSRKLEFSRRDNSALFTDDVELSRRDLLALADTLYHQPDSNRTQMRGAPLLWRGEDELSGKQIDILYKGQAVRNLTITGDAIALSPARAGDYRKNRLRGRKLVFDVIDDSSHAVHCEGDAVGRYFVWDEKDVYQGVNLAAADVIDIAITGKKTTLIDIVGKANGAFYPPGFEPPDVIEPAPKRATAAEKGE